MIRHSKWAMIVCFGLLACSDDDSGIISPTESEPEASIAATLTLTQDQYTLVSLGASANLRVTATDQYGVYMANPAITWSTSDSLNVNVNSRGLITAMSQGTAIITAQAGTATTTASVTIKQEAADLAFTEDIIRFEVIQDTTRLVPIVKDSRGNLIDPFEATWSSGNESIVTVDNEGLITSVGNGRTGITMSSGSISEFLPVIVATDGLITISSITPSVLTEGSSGVIVGTGLWGTSGNQLTIGGHSVQVTAA
ncbi:uncharacterized protein METZ01_LOCUS320796, partial [marine metagenome]